MKIKDRGPSMRRLWAVTALLAAVVGAALFHSLRNGGHRVPSAAAWRSGAPMAAPSQAAYERLQRDPAALSQNPAYFAAEFEAAPWLLPPRTTILPYARMHDLDELLALRAKPAGTHEKAVVVLLFNAATAAMAENSIYSLVKHGGVQNYVVVCWTPTDLDACADLNLPCADGSQFLARPLDKPGSSSTYYENDWLTILWIKPPMLVHLLEAGYAVIVADIDVAYTAKPLWESCLEFMAQGSVDAAFQREHEENPVNGGFYAMLPTPAAISFAKKWAAMAPSMLEQKKHEQDALGVMKAGPDFLTCSTLCECYQARRKMARMGSSDTVPVFRTFQPALFHYTRTFCLSENPEWTTPVDACDWQVLFVHAICTLNLEAKQSALRNVGFWFMDSEQGCAPMNGATSGVTACRPLQWRVPQTEAPHYTCPHPNALGLVYGAEPAAVTALRRGITAEEEARLLDDDRWPGGMAPWCYI
ncbi:hypothetical protein D9Q98_001470 [Chlorella vulgaris]|uniref:Nucleotide-diphospho-sugar transferase domain-containing protein n=1 Tax=Chlorella vulgaris TaxID=3077 RepID=A0A9D4Z2Q4_CHLVU|nr:hypothetical protein D9Q98_001470 [Chlorella vulgaris]